MQLHRFLIISTYLVMFPPPYWWELTTSYAKDPLARPYLVHFAADPIDIDGRLDDSSWKESEAITCFYNYAVDDQTPLPETKARILWDRENLYVAFECSDDDIWSYSEVDDDPLYLGDVVELFVKPSPDSLGYYEFVVAPNGTIYDARYPSRGAGLSHRFGKWNANARIATEISGSDDNTLDDDRGYVVEMAIPLKSFTPTEQPNPDSKWSFGLFRYDFSKSYEDPLMLMSIPKASKRHGFHAYEFYAPLQFED